MASSSLKTNVGDVERAVCLVVGALLFLKGLLTRRAFKTGLGGLLIYRGFTGNCKCYEALGIDTTSEGAKS